MTLASGFDPVPSLQRIAEVSVIGGGIPLPESAIVGHSVTISGDVPADLGVDRSSLEASGFTGAVGQALVIPQASGMPVVAVGVGDPSQLDVTSLRDAAAAFANAANKHASLATTLADAGELAADVAAQAVVEGAVLARYEYAALKNTPTVEPLASLTLKVSADELWMPRPAPSAALRVRESRVARDLANSPPAHLTATRMAEAATSVAARLDSTSRSSTRTRSSSSAAADCSASTRAATSRPG